MKNRNNKIKLIQKSWQNTNYRFLLFNRKLKWTLLKFLKSLTKFSVKKIQKYILTDYQAGHCLLLQPPVIHIPQLHTDPSRTSKKTFKLFDSYFYWYKHLTSCPSMSWSLCDANGSLCSWSKYFSRLKNVSKNIGVILQFFKSLSATLPGVLGFIMSNIWHKQS